jgi:uncharacterized LabA/DUF88 family protein
MRTLGVFVDVHNLYKNIKRKYGAKLDYKKYFEWLQVIGEVKLAYAYGCQLEDESKEFIACLEAAGFIPKYKTVLTFERQGKTVKVFPSWDCGMTLDIVKAAEDVDMVILGSSSSNFCPLIEHLDKPVVVFAAMIDKGLAADAFEAIEIPNSLMVR